MKIFRLFFLLSLLICCFNCADSDNPFVRRIQQGEFTATLIETGELRPVRSTVIVMPRFDWEYGRPKIVALEKEGKLVKKGDFVIQIETSGVIKVLGKKENELAVANAELAMLLVQQTSVRQQLEVQKKTEEAAYDLAKLRTERVKFESDNQKKRAALQLKKSLFSLTKLKQSVKRTLETQKLELSIQNMKIEQLENRIANARNDLKRFTLQAPGDGIIEYRENWQTDRKVQVGDQFWPGQPLAALPDLSVMKIKTSVGETDISKLKLDLKAITRLDAFPKIPFKGKIIFISKLSRKKSKDDKSKVFDVEVLLEKTDSILKPGMTVNCEIILNELEDVFYVDNMCIFEDEKGYFLYTQKRRKKRITIGPRNNKFVVVEGKLKKGEKIITIHGVKEN